MVLTFTDGSEGVFRITVPEPGAAGAAAALLTVAGLVRRRRQEGFPMNAEATVRAFLAAGAFLEGSSAAA